MNTTGRALLFALLSVAFCAGAWRSEGINSTMALIAGVVFGIGAVSIAISARRAIGRST